MDSFESMSADLGELVPGLDELFADGGEDGVEDDGLSDILDEVVDEVIEEVESSDEAVDDEESQEKATQDSEPGDNGVKGNDLLGQALARLEAIESENRVLKQKAEASEMELNAPRFVPYSKLPPETQAMFDQLAEQYEVAPESLVREQFNEIAAEWREQVRARSQARESEIHSANLEIDRFFDSHPLRTKHGESVMASIRDAGFAKIVAVARQDPEAYKATAIALIDAHFRKAEGDEAIRSRQVKQQEQLKRSTRSEASRPASSGPVIQSSDKDGQRLIQGIIDYSKQQNPLESLFR